MSHHPLTLLCLACPAALGALLAAGCTPLIGSTPNAPPDASIDVALDRAPDGGDATADASCLPDTDLRSGTRDPSWHGGTFRSPGGLFRVIGAQFDRQSRLYLFGMCYPPGAPVLSGVLRHAADGTLDRDFGDEGLLGFNPEPGARKEGWFYESAVDASGRVYLAGHFGYQLNADALVIRLDASGQLDPEFHGGRPLLYRPTLPAGFTSLNEYSAIGLLVGADGLYIVGTDNGSMGFIAHFDLDGALDRAFARSESALDTSTSGWQAIARAGDALVVAGSRRTDGAMVVQKLSPQGVIDRSFGANGAAVALAGQSPIPRQLAAQADGAIVAVGSSQSDDLNRSRATALRFTAAGVLDEAFGVHGAYVSQRYLNAGYEFAMLAPLCDGRLVMGVSDRSDARGVGAAECLDARGALDRTFGDLGEIQGDEFGHGPGAVRVDPSTGWLYLVTRAGSQANYAIYRYAP